MTSTDEFNQIILIPPQIAKPTRMLTTHSPTLSRMTRLSLVVFFYSCTAGGSATCQIISPESELTLISNSFQFTEGPTCDTDGNVFFTNQPEDQILHYDFETKQVTTWLSPAGRSNGLFYVNKNRLIACADNKNELWEINPNSKSTKANELQEWLAYFPTGKAGLATYTMSEECGY